MFYYPDELIEEIRLNSDLVEIVSEYLRLEKRGAGYFGLCPFHREKTPSFYVEPVKQLYYCFGCNNGGNVFHFIMNIENLDFPEALRFLAERAGINLPEPDDTKEQHKSRLRKEIMEVNREAARFYYSCLTGDIGRMAQRYLFERGLSRNIIKRFGLGYSPSEWDALTKHLLSKGYSEATLVEAGLCIKNKNGKLYDRFRGRVMFPIFDIRGNVVAFGGRVLDDKLPKYINSPETLVYSKGRELFGMHIAKKNIEKKILVVEGYMDVIALHQAGIPYAVASLGTALTNMQSRILKKYADEIIISYDTDSAGKKATERGLEVLGRLGCRVKVLQMPDGKDPDEYIRKNGPEKFKNLADRALSLLEYRIKQLKDEFPQDSIDGKMAFLNGAADILAEQDNIVEREIVMKSISRDYNISFDALLAETNRRISRKKRMEKSKEFATAKKELTGSIRPSSFDRKKGMRRRYEMMLISLLSRENHLFREASERYPLSCFSDGTIRETAGILYRRLSEGNDFLLEEFITKLNADTASEIIHLVKSSCNFENPEKAMDDIITKLEVIKLEEEKKDILMHLKNITDMDEKKQLELKLQSVIEKIRMSKQI
ncbi:MAG: DNA primase [Clostridiaceae bacterium]|nr:DNA primase [Clostridiaceae bacterium]